MRRRVGRPRRLPVQHLESAVARHHAGESWRRIGRDYRVSGEALRSAIRRFVTAPRGGVVESGYEAAETLGGPEPAVKLPAHQGGPVARCRNSLPRNLLTAGIPTTLQNGPTEVRSDGSLWDRSGRCIHRPPAGVRLLADPGWSPDYPAPVVVYNDRTVVRRLTGEIVGCLPLDVGPGRRQHLDLTNGQIQDFADDGETDESPEAGRGSRSDER